MLGKILIVDQIATNRIALRAKLGAAQFEACQSDSLETAMRMIRKSPPELILTSAILPDGTAQDLLAALDQLDGDVRPPVMVICSDDEGDLRLSLLNAGADDVISKSIDSTLLLARIRTHVREASSDAEWHLRDDTTRALGFAEAATTFHPAQSVSMIGPDPIALGQLEQSLRGNLPNTRFRVNSHPSPIAGNEGVTDAYILVFGSSGVPDMLRLMSSLRCHRASRNAAIFVLQAQEDPELAAYALDMGANDLVLQSAPPSEIALRLTALLKRKRQSDQLRTTLQTGLEAAVSDPLTGLHNRRYAFPHLTRMLERAETSARALAVMLADMDHFKQINDQYGHAAGDSVLVETARRLRENLRAVDLLARIGGEEFLIVLPSVTLPNARKAANRLCGLIHDTPFKLPDQKGQISASVSIGLTVFDPVELRTRQSGPLTPDSLIARADDALYLAKEKGRNRVRLVRPAA